MTANSNAHANGSRPMPAAAAAGAAVYVDTENLQDAARAHDVVRQVIAAWPPEHPPVGSLSLYVRADKAELWRMWVAAEYPGLRFRVRGVQHFSNNRAKNSADLAITADAVADLITGQTGMVAVISNDSDFGALFVKVRELAETAAGPGISAVAAGAPPPFLWITAPDAGLLSPEIEKFIHARYRWDLSDSGDDAVPPAPVTVAPTAVAPPVSKPTVSKPAPKPLPQAERPALPAAAAPTANGNSANPAGAAIAEELIRRLPLGRFKVADAQRVIKNRWPKLADAGDTAKLGTYLLKEVWPELQKLGATMPVTRSPRAYEITPAAKAAIAGPTVKGGTAVIAVSASEPSPERLAAVIAAGIADDAFSATQAQAIIKTRFPGFAAADTTPQRFGAWFAENLWPVMQRHGVSIAREKPRRYEMTPDARSRLALLVGGD